MVMVKLSALFERFSVSRMRDFYKVDKRGGLLSTKSGKFASSFFTLSLVINNGDDENVDDHNDDES